MNLGFADSTRFQLLIILCSFSYWTMCRFQCQLPSVVTYVCMCTVNQASSLCRELYLCNFSIEGFVVTTMYY
ncbi:hypothetical protein SEVIR_8G025350v4 [Setaria viridis]|uniref:Uncharacterized protein n=1 Tax=Setaria viridis TaxID=4556 RepID=A0A4U6TET0_SETVI|nr:hypothetical protein SEVIR_8G025350v2 [Setaria viridis]